MSKEELRRKQAKTAARKGLSARIAIAAAVAVALVGWAWALTSTGT